MTDSKDASTALAVYDGPEYAVMQTPPDEIREIFLANMDDDVDEFDIDGVSIPGSGGLSWNVPDINGEPVSTDELVGVVILMGNRRAYWSKSFDETGGGSPPDCSSLDANNGVGFIRGDDPTKDPVARECKTCPMSQWGSKNNDPEDNQQACSKRKLAFLVRPDDIIPLKVDLAPTSVKPFKKFMNRLSRVRVMKHGAVVGLRLINDKSRTGIKYSVVSPRLLSTLNAEQAGCMKALGNALEPHFLKTGLTQRSEEDQHAAAPSGGDEAPPEAAEPEGEESGELFENEPQAEPAAS